MRITDFYKYEKKTSPKISMITTYDYCGALIAEKTDVDCVLVGDSLAMTVYGFNSTIYADEKMMRCHTAAVKRGIKSKLIISDMPFLSFRKGDVKAVETAGKLVKAGADAVKLEGVLGHEKAIEKITGSGIPVMGHLGLTPQYIKKIGKYSIQGKDEKKAGEISKQAKTLENLGCFSLVLECVPPLLAAEITASLEIPVIGIGSGPHTDGQVLVFHDIIGLYPNSPSFAKKYANAFSVMEKAINDFNEEVKKGIFPKEKYENNKEARAMGHRKKKI